MLKIIWFFYDFQDFSFLLSGGSKRAQDVAKTAEDGPRRAPRRPKMALLEPPWGHLGPS